MKKGCQFIWHLFSWGNQAGRRVPVQLGHCPPVWAELVQRRKSIAINEIAIKRIRVYDKAVQYL